MRSDVFNQDNFFLRTIYTKRRKIKKTTSLTVASVEPGGAVKRQKQFEFLSFTLSREEYGVGIQKVQELCGYDLVTCIANAPEFVKGVVNLRGTIVPIIDMRIKFGLGTPVNDQFTVVIIINVCGYVMGIVVHSVSEVITLCPEQVKPAPQLGTAMETDHLIDIVIYERMLILIDIDQLMSGADFGFIEKLAA